MAVEFKEWPKMARFSREIIITEKIDGTNSSIFINNYDLEEDVNDKNIVVIKDGYTMRIGSRTRWITPQDDNFGFANWALKHSDDLFNLGEGHHFGEWWGNGIQRGYNLPKGEKRFSLFNVSRWGIGGKDESSKPTCCYVVPILYKGEFITEVITETMNNLQHSGSQASLYFPRPEGIIIWHTAANIGFKKTFEKDEGKWS